jgi:Leucine-rich repeat (LRR) protein
LSNNQIESVIPLSNFDNLWRVDLSENCIDTNKYEDVLESLAGDVNYKEQYLCYK